MRERQSTCWFTGKRKTASSSRCLGRTFIFRPRRVRMARDPFLEVFCPMPARLNRRLGQKNKIRLTGQHDDAGRVMLSFTGSRTKFRIQFQGSCLRSRRIRTLTTEWLCRGILCVVFAYAGATMVLEKYTSASACFLVPVTAVRSRSNRISGSSMDLVQVVSVQPPRSWSCAKNLTPAMIPYAHHPIGLHRSVGPAQPHALLDRVVVRPG